MTRKRTALIATILLVVIVGGIVAGLLLTASDSSKSDTARYAYPQSAVDNILASCEKRLKAKTCMCVVAAYKSTMPYATFRQVAFQGVSTQTRAVVQTFQAKSAACPR
jgi:hypothetical protein